MGWEGPDTGHGCGSPGEGGRSPQEGPATTAVRASQVSVPFPEVQRLSRLKRIMIPQAWKKIKWAGLANVTQDAVPLSLYWSHKAQLYLI